MPVRGVDFLSVGFWNVEKHTSVTLDENAPLGYRAPDSTQYLIDQIMDWYRLSKFDILIMAEVPDAKGKGDAFAQTIANRINTIGFPRPGMRGGFRWSETREQRKSVCNFAYVWDEEVDGLAGLGGRTDFVWLPDHARPMIEMNAGRAVIGGIHAKAANHEAAMRQIVDCCGELEGWKKPAVLIGDMNVGFKSIPAQDKMLLNSMGWEAVPPGLAETHRSRNPRYKPKVLDYIWRGDLAGTVEATPPFDPYMWWQENDHAPIQYTIAFGAQDDPMEL